MMNVMMVDHSGSPPRQSGAPLSAGSPTSVMDASSAAAADGGGIETQHDAGAVKKVMFQEDLVEMALSFLPGYPQQKSAATTATTTPRRKDPIMELYEYYQHKGVAVQIVKTAFQFIPSNSSNPGRQRQQLGCPPFYRCQFQCPITKTILTSSWFINLLLDHHDQQQQQECDSENEEQKQELLQKIELFLSDFERLKVVDEEETKETKNDDYYGQQQQQSSSAFHYYFRTKQAAKKSCAISMLIMLYCRQAQAFEQSQQCPTPASPSSSSSTTAKKNGRQTATTTTANLDGFHDSTQETENEKTDSNSPVVVESGATENGDTGGGGLGMETNNDDDDDDGADFCAADTAAADASTFDINEYFGGDGADDDLIGSNMDTAARAIMFRSTRLFLQAYLPTPAAAMVGQNPTTAALKKDPIMKLYESYQSKGVNVQIVSASFQFIPSQEVRGPSFFRCTFTCPLTSETATSCMFAACLIKDNNDEDGDGDDTNDKKEIFQQAKAFFSEFKVVCSFNQTEDDDDDGFVYFQSKQAAKKSCALSMLLKLQQQQEEPSLSQQQQQQHRNGSILLAASVQEAEAVLLTFKNKLKQQHQQQLLQKSGTSDVSLEQQQQKQEQGRQQHQHSREKRFPSWVDQVYDLRFKKINISYHEHLEGSVVRDFPMLGSDDDDDNNNATTNNVQKIIQMCCHISVPVQPRGPEVSRMTEEITILGPPSHCRKEALRSAVLLLQEKVREMDRDHSRNNHANNKSNINDNKTSNNNNSTNDMIKSAVIHDKDDNNCKNGSVDDNRRSAMIKQTLRNSNLPQANYIECFPTWAAEPFSINQSTATGPTTSTGGYLYELLIYKQNDDKIGKTSTPTRVPLVAEKMKLNPTATTRIGILFPRDIEPFFDWSAAQSSSSTYATSGSDAPQQENRTSEHYGDVAAYTADFILRDPNSDGEEYAATVELRRRTIVSQIESTHLDWLKRLNLGLTMGESYARLKGFRTQAFHWNKTKIPMMNEDYRDGGRTYLFVPLVEDNGSETSNASLSIDWDTIKLILADRPTSYLDVAPDRVFLSNVGNIQLEDIRLFCLGIVIAIVFRHSLQYFHTTVGSNLNDSFWSLSAVEIYLVANALAGLVLLQFHVPNSLSPSKSVAETALTNRLIIHRERMYVIPPAQGEQRLTATSPFPNDVGDDQEERRNLDKQRFGIDLSKSNFVDYYLKKCGIRVRYPEEPLVLAYRECVDRKHWGFNPLCKRADNETVHLLPELIKILPMPRDLLYTVALGEKFMVPLERKIDIAVNSFILIKAALRNTSMLREKSVSLYHQDFATKLLDATQVYPMPAYERLEFLGDSVLGYSLALNLVLRNSGSEWNEEDLQLLHTLPAKNSTLCVAALRIHIIRLLLFKKPKWQSAYRQGGKTKEKEQSLSDNELSDTVESLLGAIYVSGRNNWFLIESLLRIIFDRLELPTCALDYKEGKSTYRFDTLHALQPNANFCLGKGFDFSLDSKWTQLLSEVEKVVGSHLDLWKRLGQGICLLSTKLQHISGREVSLNNLSDMSKTLLYCALFDNDLIENLNFVPVGVDAKLFEPLALLRDNLYFLGAHAFKLVLSKEVFRRFPTAEPGALHLLRNVAISDDVVAYIMLKSGLKEALFDREPYELEQVKRQSDEQGRIIWANNGGWLLKGGKDLFQRRMEQFSGRHDGKHKDPEYTGLAGGRLVGYDAKQPESLTDELMFSFKALIGGMVLVFGLDETWKLVGPLFDELLLLSPDELIEQFSDQSSLVRSADKLAQNRIYNT